MIRIIHILISIVSFSVFLSHDLNGQQGRLENEYKLAIPEGEVEDLWIFLQERFTGDIKMGDFSLKGTSSVEKFIDVYYDTPSLDLLNDNIGLRYRKRYKDNILLKELIQLKTPFSADAVVRNEFKYEPVKKKKTNIESRHPLIKHLDKSSQENLAFELAEYRVKLKDINEALQLQQIRSRIYLQDETGESAATITLDKVKNTDFPYQDYAEVELELNEVRYTEADDAEKKMLVDVNNELKNAIHSSFPNITIDQRPKYNKMHELMKDDILSKLRYNYMWFIYGAIVLLGVFVFTKDTLL